ncbi:MAG TPA: carbon monoxide dehydrogenase subunit G [Candidatus Acidoferrales bacterium]|nr:carbon monoxide dehydrogenase subunit G [Candidatus Acidoferrales bacterium]
MKIAGTNVVFVPQERAYEMLQDPGILASCMPGCESLEKIAENEYAMKMKMVVAAVSGQFAGTVRIADPEPPGKFRLIVEGSGKIGFVKGSGVLTLTPNESGTEVAYDGEVNIGGTIASVGQRLIDTTARMLIKRFFAKLNGETARVAAD